MVTKETERGADSALRGGSHFKCQSPGRQDLMVEASYLLVA
jgi:hypothetical protein